MAKRADKVTVFFSKIYTVQRAVVARPADGPITAKLTDPKDTLVILSAEKPKKLTSYPEKAVFCEAIMQRTVRQSIVDMLVSLKDGVLPIDPKHPPSLPYRSLSRSQPIIETDGRIAPNFAVPFEYLPPSLQDFCKHVARDLHRACDRFIATTRWRQRAATSHRPLASPLGSLWWSLDQENWFSFPMDLSAIVSTPTGFNSGGNVDKAITSLLCQAEYEPVAHELAREALELCNGSPRSALIMAVVALETGTKHYIKQIAPDTTWLIDNMGSPPVERLLTEFIPQFNAEKEREPFELSADELGNLKKRITQRNDLVHGKPAALESETIKAFIKSVMNVLYRLDYCRGLLWAKQFDHNEITTASFP